MSKKTPAVSTQLKAAQAEIEALKKKVQSETESKDRYYKMHDELQKQMEQLHQFLDAVPGAIPRKSEGENSWERIDRLPVTRMAAWLASRPH